ncbi:RNase P modulator RnpM [Chakrabartyella piscis]|uniref:RNase P modulator RnpM n=1 Tax=Chakrabartyella piscis TaxID=2918914 RepID=UPI002958C35C|nr:YlxR family protein [Chakrabartyella piscis]
MKQRKIPLRKCTGCQEMKNKKELIRIVRGEEGTFSFDPTGKKAGRGAYICANADCLAKAQKSKGLERSFKSPVPKDVYESLMKELLTGVESIGERNE